MKELKKEKQKQTRRGRQRCCHGEQSLQGTLTLWGWCLVSRVQSHGIVESPA